MAAPITHIVLTNKIFQKHFKDKDKADFYIGTSFPDIRYLGVIERDKVHSKNLKPSDIKEETSFWSGLKFHSFLDEIRGKFVKSRGIYDFVPESKYKTQAVKLIEDQILYDKLSNWKAILGYFDHVCDEEFSLGASPESVKRWHSILTAYFSGKPQRETVKRLFLQIGWPAEAVGELLKLMEVIEGNKEIKETSLALYNDFESLL